MAIRKLFRAFMILLFSFGIFVLALKIIDWMNKSPTFTLNDVVVKGNRLLKTEDIIHLIPTSEGVNMTSLNLQEIQNSIEQHQYIESALVSRRFPSTLHIDIIERMPVAFLMGSQLYAIDRQGILLPVLHSVVLNGLPVITGIKNFKEKPGERIDSDRVMKAIQLINSIRVVDFDLFQDLSEVHYDQKKGYLTYFNNGKFPVYFGYEQFFEEVQKLQAFFQRVKAENRFDKLKYVDLRFEEQVVAKFNG